MSLFPLPAIIFLCCLIGLLIIIAIIYFTVLKKDLCRQMEGSVEEGEEPLLDGTDTQTAAAPTGETTGEDGGGGGGSTADVTDGGGGSKPATPATSNIIGTPDSFTSAPPAPSVVGAGDSVSAAGDPVGFIESEEPEQLCIAGKILIQFTYMPAANKINLSVIRAQDMPPVERGGSENIQVHLCVLPQRKQRFRTKAVTTTKGVFNETFQFIHMTIDLVESCAIRLRVYGTQRFSKRLIGEAKVPLSQVDLTSPLSDEAIWKTLSPKGLVALYYGIDEEDEPDLDDW